MKKEIDKMAGKIERKEFAGIKLDKVGQRTTRGT